MFGLFKKLGEGITQSSNKLSNGITDIFTKKKLDDETLAQLEELLITSDIGPVTAAKICSTIANNRFDKEVTIDEIRLALADEIEKILKPVEKSFSMDHIKPHVMMMVGVNGAGKTTTIGKLAHRFKAHDKKVMLAAGDTFRAAAVEQLKVWGARLNAPVVSKDEGSDAAALAYDALDQAIAQDMDVLFLDTAGRLQNKTNLMAELQKIVRVMEKRLPNVSRETLLVLDATVGQNAHSQVEVFKEIINITGIIVTKLDGTAKAGVLVSLAERFALPVYAIGMGEGIDDLRSFSAHDFAHSLVGIKNFE